ncbi:MAG TPA: response regulator transcription factor [Hansschlegelia sp.]
MNILIADDHWLMRKSLREVLQKLDRSHVVHEASSFDESVAILERESEIDLVLADLVMPGFNEVEGLARLRRAYPTVPVVVVSVHEDKERVMRALDLGVIGYIPKSSTGQEIEKAFERVLAGEIYVPRRLIERQGAVVAPPAVAAAPAPPRPEPEGLDTLTGREREVLEFLGKGCSNQRIAEELGLSSHTVRVHLANMMRKLGLADRSAAIHYAVTIASGAVSA